MDELAGSSGAPIALNDVHRAVLTLWSADSCVLLPFLLSFSDTDSAFLSWYSASVDLRECVEAMVTPGTAINGGGSFTFSQANNDLFTTFSSSG